MMKLAKKVLKKDKKKSSFGERKIPKTLPKIKDLEYGKCIGSGFFSHVYMGKFRGSDVAIKLIERGGESHVLREVKILREIKGIENVISIRAAYKLENMVLIFEHIEGISRRRIFHRLNTGYMKRFLRQLFAGMKRVKELNIAHRDIKIDNVLITRRFRRVVLIDWGCSTHVSNDMNHMAGSRTCRSPDMLLGNRDYGFTGDMWAVGAMLVDMLTEGSMPWKVDSTEGVLIKISEIFGGKRLVEVAKKYKLNVPAEVMEKMSLEPKSKLSDYFTKRMKDVYSSKLENLISRLLEIDPEKRITVEEALGHEFFQTADNLEKQEEKQKEQLSPRKMSHPSSSGDYHGSYNTAPAVGTEDAKQAPYTRNDTYSVKYDYGYSKSAYVDVDEASLWNIIPGSTSAHRVSPPRRPNSKAMDSLQEIRDAGTPTRDEQRSSMFDGEYSLRFLQGHMETSMPSVAVMPPVTVMPPETGFANMSVDAVDTLIPGSGSPAPDTRLTPSFGWRLSNSDLARGSPRQIPRWDPMSFGDSGRIDARRDSMGVIDSYLTDGGPELERFSTHAERGPARMDGIPVGPPRKMSHQDSSDTSGDTHSGSAKQRSFPRKSSSRNSPPPNMPVDSY